MSNLATRWAVATVMISAAATAASSAGAGIIPITANCTLKDAIKAANRDAATAGCPAGSGADTIEMPSGAVLTLSFVDDTSDDDGPNGLPVVTSTIVIDGNGSTIARGSMGTPAFRIFKVAATGDLTLNFVTIANGHTPDSDELFVGSYGGGGIYNAGVLTLNDCT